MPNFYIVPFVFPTPFREFLAAFEVLTGCAGTITRQINGNFLLTSSLRSSKANKIMMCWTPVSSFLLYFVFHEPVSMVDEGSSDLKATEQLLTSETQVPEAFGESLLTRVSKTSSRGGLMRCQRLRSVSWLGRPC